MSIIKLHISLFTFLRRELFVKRTIRKQIEFLKNIAEGYGKALLQEYKNVWLLMDSDYQEQKKKYEKMQKLKMDLQRSLKMLMYIDEKFTKDGKSRQYINAFWRDFAKSGQVRAEVFNELMKEIR